MGNRGKDWTRKELIKDYVAKYTPITVPVDSSIKGKQTILSLSSVQGVLDGARVISLEECGCKRRVNKCDAPRDVCLSLDDKAKQAIREGAKRVSKKQALSILKSSHEAGLVHMTYIIKGQEKPFIICSCCSCCCHSLSALVRFGIADHVVSSEQIASNDLETCNNCGTCVQRCQFHARQIVGRKMEFDRSKCFGCGLCVTTCATQSIKLMPRKTFQDR